MNISILLIMMLGFEAVADAQDAFRYKVVRDKTFKDEPGQLEIDSAGIHYKSTDGKTAIEIPFEDVYEAVDRTGPAQLQCFLDPDLAPGYIAWFVNDGEETHIGVGGYASRFEPVYAPLPPGSASARSSRRQWVLRQSRAPPTRAGGIGPAAPEVCSGATWNGACARSRSAFA